MVVGGSLVVVGTGTVIDLLVVVVVMVIGGGIGRVVVGMGMVGPGEAHLPAMQIQSASQSFSVLQGSPGRRSVSMWDKRSSWGWHTQAMARPDTAWRYGVCGTSGGLDCRGGLARGGRLDWNPGICTLVVAADEVAVAVSVGLALVACWLSACGQSWRCS